jgi:integrase
VPIEADLVAVIEDYLDSRASRLPATPTSPPGKGLSRWPANTPLFVGRDGQRITRGTIQSRVRRAFRRAGPDAQPVRGALVHGLRHTFACRLKMRGIASDASFDIAAQRCGSADLGIRGGLLRLHHLRRTRPLSCVDARRPVWRMHRVQH